MSRFAGQVVLVTGASSGIGLAVAKAFAAEGASVMLSARRAAKLDEALREMVAAGGTCASVVTDVRQYDQAQRLVEETIRKFGRIDVLVNAAGIGIFGLFHSQPWEQIEHVLQTNLYGAMAVCHAAIPQLLKQGSGTIVNVSSVVAKRSAPKLAAYCASKFGLWGFTQTLALELRPKGIQVCHFCPTSTATDFHHLAKMEETQGPPEKLHSPEQVARALLDAVAARKSEHIMSLTERVLTKSHLMLPTFTDRLLSLVRKN